MGNEDDDSSTSCTSTGSSNGNDDEFSFIVETIPPSHVLQDGKHVHLPPPTDQERTRFFERSIARHGLLQKDLKVASSSKKEVESGDDEEETKSKATPKIHPLALASARLQANGINELNRAINLHTLVAGGEYFGLSNIVDPSLERLASSVSDKPPSSAVKSSSNDGVNRTGGAISSSVEAAETASQPIDEEEARVRAIFILKRNRAQFEQAVVTLKRHCQRLVATTVAQQQVDRRLRELRPFWRLVAPEHGSRALPHATKPTEIVCADVDVYFGNRVVPRFATIELCDDYTVEEDVTRWKAKNFVDNESLTKTENVGSEPSPTMGVVSEEASNKRMCTRADTFSIANPSLGKIDTDFDPYNVAMLTLQCDIEMASTGFCVSARLQPFSRRVTSDEQIDHNTGSDENLLMTLQHSLFCSKLFESIRRELAADTESIGQVRTTAKIQSAVWMTGNSDDNYLPPSSLMIAGLPSGGLAPLCIVHVHEGDVKVLLDCQYTLRVRLVEANDASKGSKTNGNATEGSGSQSPEVLLMLCETLLLHMEERYHSHSMQKEARLQRDKEQEERRRVQFLKDNPHVKIVPPMNMKDATASPCTLQSSVSLGAKILFEQRIRKVLKSVKEWLKVTVEEPLTKELFCVEWLALSAFDLVAQFTFSYLSLSFDANIFCDGLTMTRFGDDGEYRKATFHSAEEFDLFLRTSLRRALRSS